MRFDAGAKTLEISVRELAEDEGFHRIGFGREGWSVFGGGAEMHARILNERCLRHSGYRKEVHLQGILPLNEWTVILTGRLDGCMERPGGGWLIEEFKSGFYSANETEAVPVGESFERHRRQLLFYCHLWETLHHAPAQGALVYVDLATNRESRIEISHEPAELSREIEQRLRRRIGNCQAQEAVRRRKAECARTLPFPHNTVRPGQEKLMAAVRRAIESSENLLAEAPTGSGKTAASLFPALAAGLASGRQVVFLTSKTLQQSMAVSAMVAMNREGVFRTLQMRAKEKMCANGKVICHEDFCPYAKNYPEKMARSGIIERLVKNQTHHDPALVFAEAKAEEVCPFEVQLELAARADALVADYNYLIEPGAALRHLDLENLPETVLLVDEAHNLAERARRIYSPEIVEEQFRLLTAQWQLPSGALFTELSEVAESGLELLRLAAVALPEGKTAAIAEIDPPRAALAEFWKKWERYFLRYLLWKREMKVVQVEDAMVDFHYSLQRLMAVLSLFGPDFSCVIERRAGGLRLALVCLDAARPLRPIFGAASASIFLSATLSPLGLTGRSLGLEKERTSTVSLPPPFPRENRRVLVLPQVRTTFSARERNYQRIAGLIAGMSDAQAGNTLVLFPSYQFLAAVAGKLPSRRARLLVQRSNFSERERQEIFDQLKESPPEGILLLAVLGGMYAEGVDYPGELLSGVFIVSPGLPQVTFERELLRRYYDEQGESGFEHAYLHPGMTRVIQAAGRLIRSETDRGVIALFCQRFLEEPYASRLPRDWYDESPLELVARNPAEDILNFFRQSPGHE